MLSSNKKLRIGLVTSSIIVRTGFSSNIRNLLPYLYKKNKYILFHLNEGMPSNHPEFGRFPWHNEGVMDPGKFNQEEFNKNHGYQRTVSYGNLAVKDFVINNKLDCLILEQDPWAFEKMYYLDSKWFPKMRDNVLLHTTVDSLPILPLVREWAEACPNVWFWTSFGVKALKKENSQKYGHLDYCFGACNPNHFKPISLQQKNELRKQFGLSEKDIIFIQLGRNQLRKLLVQDIEALAKFKKQNPEHKNAKLLLHCSFAEPMGWNLPKARDDFGLAKEDLLATYYCKNCKYWMVRTFEVEGLNCPRCNSHQSFITAGIQSTITDEELSLIYGLCDASLNPITSGGYEYACPQSLLCGLPLLSTDYSSGEDFAELPFVFSLDGTYTYEVQTGFKKHVPNINTIIKYYKKICEMSYEERREIGQKGREWSLQNVTTEVIGKKFENWLDSRKPHNWDFTIEIEKPKNPNANIPDIQDNKEWIKTLYKEILNMEIQSDQDSGFLYWCQALANGMSRSQIESYFRSVANQENSKNGVNQVKLEDILENTGRKRYLLVLKEAAGDILNSTMILESIKKQYPDHDLYYATDPQYFELLEGNPYIFKLLPFHQSMLQELAMVSHNHIKNSFDVYCNLGVQNQMVLNYVSRDKIDLKLKD